MQMGVHRVAFQICAGVAALALTACGSSHPSERTVADALKAELPAQVSVGKFECDYTPAGSKRCDIKFRGIATSTEPLFVEFTDSPAAAFPVLEQIEQQLIRSQAAGIRFSGEGGNEFTQKFQNLAARFRFGCANIIEESVKSGQKIEFSGTAAASHEFGEWRIGKLRLQPARESFGKPRAAFSKGALVVASNESTRSIQALLDEAEGLDDLFDETVERIEREAKAKEVRARELRLERLQTFIDELRGSRFKGVAENRSVTPHQTAEIQLTFGTEAG